MKSNDELYEAVLAAAQELFSDTSVSVSETRENLETLIGEIQTMLDTLDEA